MTFIDSLINYLDFRESLYCKMAKKERSRIQIWVNWIRLNKCLDMDGSHVKKQLLDSMGTANPYEILNVTAKATAEQIKKAYRVAALKHHPDKGGDADKFKAVSIAHAILSDLEKRAIFDQTGDVDESGEELDQASFDHWYEMYRAMFPKLQLSQLDSFAEKYKNSDEEKTDIFNAYNKYKGDMKMVMSFVLMAEEEDYDRIASIIESAIKRGELTATTKWNSRKKGGKGSGGRRQEEEDEEDLVSQSDEEVEEEDVEASKKARKRGSPKVAKAAKPRAKVGAKPSAIASKDKDKGKGKAMSSSSANTSLEALIQARRESNDNIYDAIAKKYQKKGGGGSCEEPDIDDAEFEAIQARLCAPRKGRRWRRQQWVDASEHPLKSRIYSQQ